MYVRCTGVNGNEILRAVNPKEGSSELQKATCQAVIKISGCHLQTEKLILMTVHLPSRVETNGSEHCSGSPRRELLTQHRTHGGGCFDEIMPQGQLLVNRNPANKLQGIV